jgi:imidazolonepropionase-like amidohydrolase
VNAATFLGKQREFGTIAPGMRADLLLVDGNPLHDLNRLKQPLGVMVRGRWLTRTQLQELLTELASTS